MLWLITDVFAVGLFCIEPKVVVETTLLVMGVTRMLPLPSPIDELF